MPQERAPGVHRYRKARKLAEDDSGIIWLAEDLDLGRRVLLKEPATDRLQDPEDVDRYLREARFLANLDHPNIAPIYDFGRDPNGSHYVVGQLIEGQDLSVYFRTRNRSFENVAEVVSRIASALQHVHHRGLVHRRINPRNILIDDQGQLFVTNFSLSRRDEEFAFSREPLENIAYLSPEQVSGEGHRVDYRSDIFSLGVVMYELLTGFKPFSGVSVAEVTEHIRSSAVRPPCECDATIPLELERICLRALAKRASDRYVAAFDMAEDLRHWMAVSVLTVPHDQPRIVPKGLRSFDAGDRSFFSSLLPGPRDRDGLPDSLRFWKTRIEAADAQRAFPVGVVYGPSGCGKSSLIKAGLLPQLADHVLRVFVEATDDQTEEQLLRAVRQADVRLPQNLPLVETLQQFCRKTAEFPPRQKLLIVIDQFEQWLHGNAGQPDSELSRALRVCDGERLQTLLLVRDDFWMPITRLLREIHVSLVENQNAMPVDLFDPLHARHVLLEFGKAYGRLPEHPRGLTTLQSSFLDRAIAGLTEHGKVICVQLALFAHMMKSRVWHPQTLQDMGGIVGVGQMFLEETFYSPLAPPRHHQHQAAARAVLRTLLPENGSDIKGQRRTVDELCDASGYPAKSRDFQELLAILDGELRLVTPVMSDGVITSYQLTHDYLVPVLRDWLVRKQRENRRGRAELRLQERAEMWERQPERRYLPSLMEFFSIWLWTDRRLWKKSECGMMKQANRFYATWSTAVMLLILFGLGVSLMVSHQVHKQQEAIRIETLVARLASAEPEQLSPIIQELHQSRVDLDAWLSPLLDEQAQTPQEKRMRLHARLVAVAKKPALVAPLIEDLLAGDVRYIEPICQQLQPWSSTWHDTLRQILRDEMCDSTRRARAALALVPHVGQDGVNSWTESELQVIAQQLVRESVEHQAPMRKILRPIHKLLIPKLQTINESSSYSDEERLSAANALVDYAGDPPVVMSRLVAEASAMHYGLIYESVKPLVTEEVLGELSRIAAATPPRELTAVERVQFGGRRANAAMALLQLGKFTATASALQCTDDPESLTQFIIRCRVCGVPAITLIDCLDAVSALPMDRSSSQARYALMLALGDYPLASIPVARRSVILRRLAEWYANDPSASVHSAAGWLLRQWEQTEALQRVDQTAVPYSPDREWFTVAVTVTPQAAPTAVPPPGMNNIEGGAGVKAEPKKTFFFTFVVFPAGRYEVGLTAEQPSDTNQESRRIVTLTKPFAILDREVTMEEMIAFKWSFINWLPAQRSEPRNAAANIMWAEAVDFCCWLSHEAGLRHPIRLLSPHYQLQKGGFRLPTEAEWEIASRAGSRTAFGFGGDAQALLKFDWVKESFGGSTKPPKQLRPNVAGMFDMHGNVSEWTIDSARDYAEVAPVDPSSIDDHHLKVYRGGNCQAVGIVGRSAARHVLNTASRIDLLGFRLAISVSDWRQPSELQTTKNP